MLPDPSRGLHLWCLPVPPHLAAYFDNYRKPSTSKLSDNPDNPLYTFTEYRKHVVLGSSALQDLPGAGIFPPPCKEPLN